MAEPHPDRERGLGGAVPRAGDRRAASSPPPTSGAASARASTACSTRCPTAPDGLRITELSDDVLLTQAGISRLVARLESRGLVERVADPDDGRACRIRLTEAGASAQRRVGLRHGHHVAQIMTRALSVEQLARSCRDAAAQQPCTESARTTSTQRLVVISAGTSDPSSTRLLADRIAQKSLDRARRRHGATVERDRARAARRRHRARRRRRLPGRGAPGGDRPARRRRRDHRRHPGLQGRHQRAVQDVRRRPRQRPAHRQAGPARRHRRHAAPRAGHRRPAAPAVRLPARAHAARPRCTPRRRTGATTELGTRIERAATELAVLVRARRRAADRRPAPGRATSTSSPATPAAPSAPRPTSTSTRG